MSDRPDLAFYTSHSEPTGHEDAVQAVEVALGEEAVHIVGRNPTQVQRHPVGQRPMAERLDNGQIRIGQPDVLAHYSDRHRLRGRHRPLDHLPPVREVGLGYIQIERFDNDSIETLLVEDQRHLVDVTGVRGGDHRVRCHVAEK